MRWVDAIDGGGETVPADQRGSAEDAAKAASTKSSDSFTVQKSGLNVIANGVYPFSFAYLYEDPDNPSQQIPGPRSPNFLFTLQTPDLTQPVTNLVVTPGLLSYGVKWDLIDKALPANKWLIDIQIYESLTGAFTGEEYLVWNGNGNSATILVSNISNRWIRVDTRDQDYRKKSVVSGPFKATDPIVVDTTGPDNVSSVNASGGLDTTGIVGFNGYANISWPAITGGGIRGYRIRFRPITTPDSSYSYADSPGTGTSYRLAGLGAGLTYEIAVATYDEYNNTSSSYVSGSNVTVGGTPYIASTVDVTGFFRAKANPTDADSTAFKFGYGIETGKRGLAFNASNYWHIDSSQSALFKVGGPTSNYLLWDGSKLTVDGDINAKGGNFSGNIFMSTSGASIYNGTIDSATGNLTGNGFALNSTGLKVANGVNSVTIAAATGTITANAGSIGGWSLSGSTLSKNNVILDSTGQIQVGATAANSVYLKSSGDYVIWAGNNTPDANAKFRVHKDGTLYAVGAVFGTGSSIAGYATSAQLTAVNTTATNAATAAQTAATDANTAKVSAAAAKAIADAALPSTSFNRDAIVNSINSTTTTTTINGGKITTGTISANAVVSDFISAFSINADKITAGTIGTTISITTPNITVGSESDSYYFKTNQIRTGTTRAALGLNNVNMISANSAGMLSNWYPYNNDDVSLGIVSPYIQRWKNIFLINNPNVSSDFRLKRDISETRLGLDFIKSLKPVEYKLKARSRKDKLDENGNIVYYPGTDKSMPDLNEDDPGNRYHYGFIAQEVKESLDLAGVGDVAGLWAIDNLEDPDSTQALVYSEFISPLTKAVQELSDMVESLQQEVNTLKGI